MPEFSETTDAVYRTSSFSGGGNCVQVARLATGDVAVKHSRSERSPFVCTPQEWDAFVMGVKTGEFDFSLGEGS